MDIEKIKEKIKDSQSMAQTKKRLTTEELVTLLLTDMTSDEPVTEEDVELIAQVLEKVSEKKCSVRHAQFFMDACRKLILAIATFQV